jgi:hypothetical protein
VGDAQSQTEETRREALKTHRELAEKEPETYLPDVAATLNDLGIFDSDKNQMNEARMEYEEALKIYRELAEKEPELICLTSPRRSTIWVFWIGPRTDQRRRGRFLVNAKKVKHSDGNEQSNRE